MGGTDLGRQSNADLRCRLHAPAAGAEAVLVAAPRRLEVGLLVRALARRGLGPPDVGGAGPRAAEAGTNRARGVVHLPVRPEAVPLVGCAQALDHALSDREAKGAEGVQGRERAGLAAEARGGLA
jgi:hypothetical protein